MNLQKLCWCPSSIYFNLTLVWWWQEELLVWHWIYNLKYRVLSPLWAGGVDYLIPPLFAYCNPVLTSLKGENMGQFSCSFSSFYLFSQFTITAASDQDGSFSAAELQQLKNKVTPWHNFSHGAAWLSHRSRLQSLQIGFKVATKPCFLPWYLPSKIEHMILCIIYRLSKTSLSFWFITLLTDTRDLVSPLASHILQLPIMTNSTLVWLSLASFVHYFV